MMFIHYQNSGHGLNFQHVGRMLVLYDMIWSLEMNLQIIGRIDRQGQTKPVIVQMLVSEGTRDEVAYDSFRMKEDAKEKFFQILKRLIREFRARRVAQAT